MLRLLEPSTPRPYRVPWRVDRVYDTHPLVTNDGDEAVEFVRVFRSDGTTEHWGRLLPGETAELCLCEADLNRLVITLAWFRPDTGEEYCWRFVM